VVQRAFKACVRESGADPVEESWRGAFSAERIQAVASVRGYARRGTVEDQRLAETRAGRPEYALDQQPGEAPDRLVRANVEALERRRW
jgi:hypothetical protein